MSPAIKLAHLSPGQTGTIISIEKCINRKRLFELGFFPGAHVKYLFSGVFGDPKAFLIQNSVIALRHSESEKIYIKGAR